MEVTHPCDRSITYRQIQMSEVTGVRGHSGSSKGVSHTLHAGGAKLLPGQVDGVVVLFSVTLLPLLQVGPSTDILQTLLRVPHRDQLLGLNKNTVGLEFYLYVWYSSEG